jgi:hypothetical protein
MRIRIETLSVMENQEFYSILTNAGMLDRPASGHSGTRPKKINDAATFRYRTEVTQSDIFLHRYRTKMTDAGMPMPALVFSMPMPTYAGTGT